MTAHLTPLAPFGGATWFVLPAVAYLAGRHRLRARGSGLAGPLATACAMAGIAIVAVALAPGMDEALGRTFALHMVQHLAIGVVAPLLLAVGRTADVVSWAVPSDPRGPFRRAMRRARHHERVPVATAVLVAAWYAWHVPALHDAAVRSAAVHAVEHVAILGAGWWFWAAVAPRRRRAGSAIVALFAATVSLGLLGAVLSLSPRVFYDAYQSTGTSALDDQHLGGLLMWTPGGLVYLGAAAVVLLRWLDSGRGAGRPPSTLSRREVGLS